MHAIEGYYHSNPDAEAALLRQHGVRLTASGGHADAVDTSLMMAVDPAMVRRAKLQVGDGRNGVRGDPRAATAVLGRALIEQTVAHTVVLIRKATAAR